MPYGSATTGPLREFALRHLRRVHGIDGSSTLLTVDLSSVVDKDLSSGVVFQANFIGVELKTPTSDQGVFYRMELSDYEYMHACALRDHVDVSIVAVEWESWMPFGAVDLPSYAFRCGRCEGFACQYVIDFFAAGKDVELWVRKLFVGSLSQAIRVFTPVFPKIVCPVEVDVVSITDWTGALEKKLIVSPTGHAESMQYRDMPTAGTTRASAVLQATLAARQAVAAMPHIKEYAGRVGLGMYGIRPFICDAPGHNYDTNIRLLRWMDETAQQSAASPSSVLCFLAGMYRICYMCYLETNPIRLKG